MQAFPGDLRRFVEGKPTLDSQSSRGLLRNLKYVDCSEGKAAAKQPPRSQRLASMTVRMIADARPGRNAMDDEVDLFAEVR